VLAAGLVIAWLTLRPAGSGSTATATA
jgi:hypothetical protein